MIETSMEQEHGRPVVVVAEESAWLKGDDYHPPGDHKAFVYESKLSGGLMRDPDEVLYCLRDHFGDARFEIRDDARRKLRSNPHFLPEVRTRPMTDEELARALVRYVDMRYVRILRPGETVSVETHPEE